MSPPPFPVLCPSGFYAAEPQISPVLRWRLPQRTDVECLRLPFGIFAALAEFERN